MEKCGAQPRCAAHCRSTVTLNNNLIPLASNPDCAKRSVKGGIRPKKSLATTVPSVPKVSWWKKRIWHCCDTILAWDSDFWQILDSDLSVISLSYQDLALPPSFFGLLPANLWLKETRWQLGQSLQLLKTPQLSVPYLRNAHHIHNYIILHNVMLKKNPTRRDISTKHSCIRYTMKSNSSWFRDFRKKILNEKGQHINGDISPPRRGPVAMSYPEEVVHQHLCQHAP